ncbi:MAG: hypothetical protein EP298_03360 [Gammaproteobacteria bacterium]|nr:MAG: hypothetical protein EP298_03360 [Gammaproteobacteria bacterium]UTW43496.1 hypothetical protein KFE69_05230 [bacterium SCSIO 12844]
MKVPVYTYENKFLGTLDAINDAVNKIQLKLNELYQAIPNLEKSISPTELEKIDSSNREDFKKIQQSTIEAVKKDIQSMSDLLDRVKLTYEERFNYVKEYSIGTPYELELVNKEKEKTLKQHLDQSLFSEETERLSSMSDPFDSLFSIEAKRLGSIDDELFSNQLNKKNKVTDKNSILCTFEEKLVDLERSKLNILKSFSENDLEKYNEIVKNINLVNKKINYFKENYEKPTIEEVRTKIEMLEALEGQSDEKSKLQSYILKINQNNMIIDTQKNKVHNLQSEIDQLNKNISDLSIQLQNKRDQISKLPENTPLQHSELYSESLDIEKQLQDKNKAINYKYQSQEEAHKKTLKAIESKASLFKSIESDLKLQKNDYQQQVSNDSGFVDDNELNIENETEYPQDHKVTPSEKAILAEKENIKNSLILNSMKDDKLDETFKYILDNENIESTQSNINTTYQKSILALYANNIDIKQNLFEVKSNEFLQQSILILNDAGVLDKCNDLRLLNNDFLEIETLAYTITKNESAINQINTETTSGKLFKTAAKTLQKELINDIMDKFNKDDNYNYKDGYAYKQLNNQTNLLTKLHDPESDVSEKKQALKTYNAYSKGDDSGWKQFGKTIKSFINKGAQFFHIKLKLGVEGKTKLPNATFCEYANQQPHANLISPGA